VLSADQAKGLEFDHMVVVEPAVIAGKEEDWALVYIALTRATRTLSVLYSTPEAFVVPATIKTPEPEAGRARIVLEDVPRVDGADAGTVLTGRYTEALIHAKFLHSGLRRRGTAVPYLAHLQAVAALVLEDGGSEDEAIAALLHDAVESHGPEVLDDVIDRFGVTVARIVDGCSVSAQDPSASWRARKTAHLHALESAGPEVRRVVLAEGLDNARALLRDYRRLGPRLWVDMKVDPEDLLWYRSALADLFVTERPGDMASEFQKTVEELLDLVSQPEAGARTF
jgi:(p)ppGpp synthase/HD superfamily hydrolase